MNAPGYNWLISQKTVPINVSFVKQQAVASGYVHLSKLSLYNNDDIFLSGDLLILLIVLGR